MSNEDRNFKAGESQDRGLERTGFRTRGEHLHFLTSQSIHWTEADDCAPFPFLVWTEGSPQVSE